MWLTWWCLARTTFATARGVYAALCVPFCPPTFHPIECESQLQDAQLDRRVATRKESVAFAVVVIVLIWACGTRFAILPAAVC